MKSFTILAAVLTAVSLAHAIPGRPNDASVANSVASCLEKCPQTFCEEIWPQSCYCHNAHALECWYECGGVQPQLQECPAQTTTAVGSSSSDVSALSTTSSATVAPVAPTGSIVTGSASSTKAGTYNSVIRTLTSKYKRDGSSKPSSVSSSGSFKPTGERIHCRTESKQCQGRNMHCVAATPANCTILLRGACDLPGTCEIVEMKPSPPTLMPGPTTTTTHSVNNATLPATPTPTVWCSSVTRPCQQPGEICIVPNDAPCRWLVLGVCDYLGTCGPIPK